MGPARASGAGGAEEEEDAEQGGAEEEDAEGGLQGETRQWSEVSDPSGDYRDLGETSRADAAGERVPRSRQWECGSYPAKVGGRKRKGKLRAARQRWRGAGSGTHPGPASAAGESRRGSRGDVTGDGERWGPG